MSDLTKSMQTRVTFGNRKCGASDDEEFVAGPFAQGVVAEADDNGHLALIDVASSKPIAVMDEDGDWQISYHINPKPAWFGRAFIQGVQA